MKTILILSLVVMTTCCLSGSFLGTSFPEVFGTKAAATETGDDLAPGFNIEPGGDVLPPVTSSTTTPTQAPTEIKKRHIAQVRKLRDMVNPNTGHRSPRIIQKKTPLGFQGRSRPIRFRAPASQAARR